MLEERARGAGMRLAEWVREALLSAPMASGPDSGEVAVGEILALRSLLLNLAGGPHLSEIPHHWVPHVSILRHGLRSPHAAGGPGI